MAELESIARTKPSLPFSAPGAVKAIEFGTYGAAAAAIVGGLAAVMEAPMLIVAAAPVATGVGLAALGYRIGRLRSASGK